MALRDAADAAHANSRGYRQRLAAARALVRSAPDGAVVGVSWGKDSVALLSIVMEERPTMPVLHYRWPDCLRPASLDAVRDELIARWALCPTLPAHERPEDASLLGLTLCPRRAERTSGSPCQCSCLGKPCGTAYRARGTVYMEVPLRGLPEAWRRAGRVWVGRPPGREQRAVVRQVLAEDGARFKAALDELGATAVLVGMRGRESRGRQVHFAVRGPEWLNVEWGMRMIAPFARWTGQDVWARHAQARLPHAAHYDAPGYDRDRVRSELTPGVEAETSWAHDEAGFWRRADPGLWRRLTSEWPDIAALAD